MFASRHAVWLKGILFCALILAGCEGLEKEGPRTAGISMRMSYQAPPSRNARTNPNLTEGVATELVALVPADSSFSPDYPALANPYQRALTNLNTSTVLLTVPLDTSLRLYAYRFSETYTLTELSASSKRADSFGESNLFIIRAGDTHASVTLNISPNGKPGFVVSKISGNTTESGNSATFTIRLATPPKNNVTLAVNSEDAGEGAVKSSSPLTFTPSNWKTPQTVTVAGVDDLIDDGDQSYSVGLKTTSSEDTDYQQAQPKSVVLSNLDDDTAGVTLAGQGCGTNSGDALELQCVQVNPAAITNPDNTPVTFRVGLGGTSEDIRWVQAEFYSPSDLAGDFSAAQIYVPQMEYNPDSGFWEGTLNFSNYHESGVWKIARIRVENQIGERREYQLHNYDNNSIFTTFHIRQENGNYTDTGVPPGNGVLISGTTNHDSTRPHLTSVEIAPATLAVPGSMIALLKVGIVEEGSGIEFVDGRLYYPENPPNRRHEKNIRFDLKYNTSSGLWEDTISLGQYHASGEWKVGEIVARDRAGNESRFYSYTDWDSQIYTNYYDTHQRNVTNAAVVSLNVTGTDPSGISSDNTAPQVTSVELSPPAVRVTEQTLVRVKVGVLETQSGIRYINSRLYSPTAWEQGSDAGVYLQTELNWDPVSGLWEGEFLLENFYESGTWRHTFYAEDHARNRGYSTPHGDSTTYQFTQDFTNYSDTGIPLQTVEVSGTNPSMTHPATISEWITTESGESASFSVHLNSQPTANVTLPLASTDTSEGAVSASSLTFTPSNWNAPQTFTVTGIDDKIDDGDQSYTFQFGAISSEDFNYAGQNFVEDLPVINLDDDTSGFSVTTSGGTENLACIPPPRPDNASALDLACVEITPSSVNNPDGTEVTLQINFSGTEPEISYVWAELQSPKQRTGDSSGQRIWTNNFRYNSNSNFWEDTIRLEQFHESGTWKIGEIGVRDHNGNERRYRISDGSTPIFSTYHYENNTSSPSTWVDSGVPHGNGITVSGTIPDETPPVLTSVQMIPTSLDRPSNSLVTVKVGLSDNHSGISFAFVQLDSPTRLAGDYSGEQIWMSLLYNESSGLWEATTIFGPYHESGTWRLTHIEVEDRAGHHPHIINAQLSANNFAYTFNFYNESTSSSVEIVAPELQIIGTNPATLPPDTTPPQLTSVALSSNAVTVSDNNSAQVLIQVGMSDNESGVQSVYAEISSHNSTSDGDRWISSTEFVFNSSSGLWEGYAVFDTRHASGTWHVSPYAWDHAGNKRNYRYSNSGYDYYDNNSGTSQGIVQISAPTFEVTVNRDSASTPLVELAGATTENGDNVTIHFQLQSEPTANVNVSLASTDTSEGVISASSLTFTPSNWNALQTVTVTGVDDDEDDGNQHYEIQFSALSSSDVNYNGITPQAITLINLDNDYPIQVIATSPEQNAVDVPLDTVLSVTFSGPVGATSLYTYPTSTCDTSSTVLLSPDNFSTCLSLGTPFSTDNRTYTITPHTPGMEYDQTYQFRIVGGTNGVSNMADNFTSSFFTPERPRIIAFIPDNNSDNISRYANLSVTFSKDMNPETLRSIQTIPFVRGYIHYDNGTHTAKFIPLGPLADNTTYTVTFPDNITDASGVPLAATTASFKSVDLSSGLVLYYPLDGNANDASINGNHGTVNNVTPTKGRFGKENGGYLFDGETSYIDTPSALNIGSGSNTFSVWARVPVIGDGGLNYDEQVGVLAGNQDRSPYLNWEIQNNGQMSLPWNGSPNVLGQTDLRDGRWHLLTFVRDVEDAEIRFYIDGKPDTTHNSAGSHITLVDSFRIGADLRTSSPQYFHGSLDDLRIYNRAMTAQAISELYTAPQRGLVAYYPFNGNADDTSGNEFDGTGNGVVLTFDRFIDNSSRAYFFDGWSKITIAHNDTLSFASPSDFSFSVWLEPQRLESLNGIFSKAQTSGTSGYRLRFNDSYGGIDFGNDWSNLIALNSLAINAWQHLAGSVENGQTKLYLNGNLIQSGAVSWSGNTDDFTIGCDYCASGASDSQRFFQGKIDDLRLYNRPLSEAEIRAIHATPDTHPPLPGDNGTLSFDNATQMLSWQAAGDDYSAQNELQYKVLQSTSDNIGSVTEIELPGDNRSILQDWNYHTTSLNVSGLASGQTYYFNVLVRDEGGNKNVYRTIKN